MAFLYGVVLDTLHDRPLYIACPDVLSLVGELFSGYG